MMSFMDDDFYSTKISSRGWKGIGSGSQRSRSRFVGIIAASVVSGAMLAFLSIPFFMGKGADVVDRGVVRAAVVMDAKASYNDMVIHAAERVNPAVVSVINGQKAAGEEGKSKGADRIEPVGLGSGVIFHKGKGKAYIVTNNHVVENADKVEIILISGEHKLARVVGTDP
ncbi:MAG TPA: S1C family serine protease, partial [Bacilli bacterium]